MNKELTSLTLDEYVDDFQLNENPDSLADIVQDGGFIRAPSITPDMIENQQRIIEEPGTLLQNGGCGCSGIKKYTEYESVQSGGESIDTNALFDQFLDENKTMNMESIHSLQSGGESLDTNALFDQFLDENKTMDMDMESIHSLQSGGESVDTNALFNQFLDENKTMDMDMESVHSLQSGGNTSVDTNALFNQFLDENKTMDMDMESVHSLQSGGENSNTKELLEKFLENDNNDNNDNNDMMSVQTGGDDSLYSSIESDLMSTGTIDLFSNFVNKYKFKKQMQMGGGRKKSESENNNQTQTLSIKEAVNMLNKVYNNDN